MIYALYSILLITLMILTLPLWLWRYVRTHKYRGTVTQRLGFNLPLSSSSHQPSNRIWIHAVSVGEVMAARGLVQQLAKQFPQDEMVLSTVTKTGQQVAKETLPALHATFYLPLDLPWIVRRVTRSIRPRCLIVMETELWPGLFHAMEKEQIPVIVVNGRLSPGSFRNYRKFSRIMKRFLAPVHLFAMQSDTDAQRMADIGALPERILVTGNIKYDQAMQRPTTDEMAELGKRWPRPAGLVWMAASTHPGEEEIVLACLTQLRKTQPQLKLILAPRHPERAAEVSALIRRHGHAFTLFSQTQASSSPRETGKESVLLVDEIGWLTRLYGYAHLAFVGGSLIPHGGQNMLEPAAWGIPTLFGPHTFNFKNITIQLLEARAAIQINHPQELFPAMNTLLEDTKQREAMGDRARSVVARNVGALQRTTQAIQALLPAKAGTLVTVQTTGQNLGGSAPKPPPGGMIPPGPPQ